MTARPAGKSRVTLRALALELGLASHTSIRKAIAAGRLHRSVGHDSRGVFIRDLAVAREEWAQQRSRPTPTRATPHQAAADEDADADADMPTEAEMRASFEGARKDAINRREAADLLEVHEGSVPQLLGEGLAATVVEWGARGEEMLFSRSLVDRWRLARACEATGRRCPTCGSILFAAELEAEHQFEKRHGFAGCVDCWVPWPRDPAPCSWATRGTAQ
jgi:hypothetical protein